jgi:hypothetical protein
MSACISTGVADREPGELPPPEPAGVNPAGRCARIQASTARGWPGTRHQRVAVAMSVVPIPTPGLVSDAISPVRTAPAGRGKPAMIRAASVIARCRGVAACDVVLGV